MNYSPVLQPPLTPGPTRNPVNSIGLPFVPPGQHTDPMSYPPTRQPPQMGQIPLTGNGAHPELAKWMAANMQHAGFDSVTGMPVHVGQDGNHYIPQMAQPPNTQLPTPPESISPIQSYQPTVTNYADLMRSAGMPVTGGVHNAPPPNTLNADPSGGLPGEPGGDIEPGILPGNIGGPTPNPGYGQPPVGGYPPDNGELDPSHTTGIYSNPASQWTDPNQNPYWTSPDEDSYGHYPGPGDNILLNPHLFPNEGGYGSDAGMDPGPVEPGELDQNPNPPAWWSQEPDTTGTGIHAGSNPRPRFGTTTGSPINVTAPPVSTISPATRSHYDYTTGRVVPNNYAGGAQFYSGTDPNFSGQQSAALQMWDQSRLQPVNLRQADIPMRHSGNWRLGADGGMEQVIAPGNVNPNYRVPTAQLISSPAGIAAHNAAIAAMVRRATGG